MDTTDALKIVIELAEGNVIDDPGMEMEHERERQLEAIEIVKNLTWVE